MKIAQVFIFLCAVRVIAMFCLSEPETLTCYNEFFDDMHISPARTLVLYDSYINRAKLRMSFPNIRIVFVSGIYVQDTCEELMDYVKIYGCRGKVVSLKLSSTFIAKCLS